jgi:hypothetical protein
VGTVSISIGRRRNVPEIRTKREFFRLWEAGALGNKLRTWRTASDAIKSGVPIVGFRAIGKTGAGAFEMTDAAGILAVATRWGATGRNYMICEAAPDERGLIQGEICRLADGYHGLIGPVVGGRRMRDSIRDGHLKPCSGLAAIDYARRHMDPSSQDDLDALLDLYPGATVEFTCYSVLLGHLPGRNTLFWEVRNY